MPFYSVVEAPSNLGLTRKGVEGLSQALLSAGLLDHLHAQYAGKVEAPPHDSKRDPDTGLLNGAPIQEFSRMLACELASMISKDSFPVALGGDCSILLGPLLKLRRLGRYGLFFLDGHADFHRPGAEPNGEVASMELALLSGRGPPILANIDGLGPLILDEDIVAFGFRDEDQARKEGSQDLKASSILSYDLAKVNGMGVGPAAEEAAAYLVRRPIEGFWIHVDADVLDDEEMPAVDHRLPGGLRSSELSSILQVLISTGKVVGLTVTIFNPTMDPNGKISRMLVECIASGLSP